MEIVLGDKISYVKRKIAPDFAQNETITGMCTGAKIVDNKETETKAIVFFVSKKLPKNEILPQDLIPGEIVYNDERFPTDVQVAPVIEASLVFNYKIRPFKPGSCICRKESFGHPTGTLGTIVKYNPYPARRYFLSNLHVLCDVSPNGDDIFQPCTDTKPVAWAHIYVALKPSPQVNYVDCALAWIIGPDTAYTRTSACGFTLSTVVGTATPGLAVRKCGCASGNTAGTIYSVDYDTCVNYSEYGGSCRIFHDQVLIKSPSSSPFAMPGDSGSVVIATGNGNPVGLLFAGGTHGTEYWAVCNHMTRVASALNISFAV